MSQMCLAGIAGDSNALHPRGGIAMIGNNVGFDRLCE
jgi:hypothetical protein